jgi:hypothetical protein
VHLACTAQLVLQGFLLGQGSSQLLLVCCQLL